MSLNEGDTVLFHGQKNTNFTYNISYLGAHTWNNGASGEGGCNSNTNPAGFCDGMANSPIDLPYNGVSIKRDWLPFQLLHYSRHPYKMYLANNGHTAVVTFDTATCYDIPTVIQGGLPGNIRIL